MIAGLLQSAQMAGSATSLTDRARIMLKELQSKRYTKTEVLDRTYVKAGLTPQIDGTKVFLTLYERNVGWRWLGMDGFEHAYENIMVFNQENFKKNALGLLAILEVGQEKGIAAIQNLEALEKRVALSAFRGAETLIPPDVEELLP
jgi:hypothetical protein